MLLSDRDIKAEIESGRVILDPWDPDMVQPSLIDLTGSFGGGHRIVRLAQPRLAIDLPYPAHFTESNTIVSLAPE